MSQWLSDKKFLFALYLMITDIVILGKIRSDVNRNLAIKPTISVDHRVSDGAEAAQLMQALAGFLENPVRMLV